MDQQRAVRYLSRYYSMKSRKELEKHLEEILDRLVSGGRFDEEFLNHVIDGLKADDWPKHKICAYIDALDLEDRT